MSLAPVPLVVAPSESRGLKYNIEVDLVGDTWTLGSFGRLCQEHKDCCENHEQGDGDALNGGHDGQTSALNGAYRKIS